MRTTTLDSRHGERLTILIRSDETEGELHKSEWTFPPGSTAPEHVHPALEESLEGISGRYGVTVNDTETILRAGDRVTIPAGTPHVERVVGSEPATIVVEWRPAPEGERVEAFLIDLFHLAEERSRLKQFLKAAVLTRRHPGLVRVSSPLARRFLDGAGVIGEVLGITTGPRRSGAAEALERSGP